MKQFKKTALILLLAMGMTLGMVPLVAASVHADDGAAVPAVSAASYDLWVGGTQVTSDNTGDILGDGTARYDADTKTLTLNGANISGTYELDDEYKNKAFIYSGTDLTIELDGVSDLSKDGEEVDYGICSKGKLTIKDDGDNGTLSISTNGEYSSAIFADRKDIVISGGTINASASGFTETSAVKTGDDEEKGNLNISGGTLELIANGWESSAIYVRDLKISSGKLTASATGDDAFALQISSGTISGGTVNASVSGEEDGDVEAIFCDDDLILNGGTVNAAAEGPNSVGIDVYKGNLEIKENARVKSVGEDKAIACGYNAKVINAVDGTGWTNTEGTEGETYIPVSTDGQTFLYKKVKFPAAAAHKITTKNVTYLQVSSNKKAAYEEETVTVSAWTEGSYSPVIYVKKASDKSIVQEVPMSASGQGFKGTFIMPDFDVIVTGKVQGASDDDKTPVVKYKTLKKKSVTLPIDKNIIIKGTPKKFTLVSAKKGSKSFKKYFKVNQKNGKITIKKGLRKGLYKVKVKISFKETSPKNVTFKIRVK